MDRIEELRRRLGEDLPRLAAAHEVPGVSMAVLLDGHVVEATAGVINLRTRVDVTPDTLFMIQSVTKVWTATLVMQLVDDGLVEVDAPVRTYLPDFRTADERASGRITVRQLLTHTGGFEGDIWAPTTSGDDALQRFVEDLVPHAAQHSEPGAMYSYCSAGYGVLGRIVEVQRGMPYADALRCYLAGPLAIEEIAFCADEALAFRTAIGHVSVSPGTGQWPLKTWALMPPSNPAAGNQLAMSARALLAFGRMHVADGLGAEGTRLLSPAIARAMRQRQVDHPAALPAAVGHGLGWMLPSQPSQPSQPGLVEHGGDTIGVEAKLAVAPEHGVAAAILTNGGASGRLIDDLLGPLFLELASIAPAPSLPTGSAEPIAEPSRYVGRYQTRIALREVTLDADGRLRLTESTRNEALTMAAVAGIVEEPQRHELRQVEGDTFVLVDVGGVPVRAVEFVGRDAAGRARFLHSGRAAPRIY